MTISLERSVAKRRFPAIAFTVLAVVALALAAGSYWAWGWLAAAVVGGLVLLGALAWAFHSYLQPEVGAERWDLVERADRAVNAMADAAGSPAARADNFLTSALISARASRDTLVHALVVLNTQERKGRVDESEVGMRRADLESQVLCLEELRSSLDELLKERQWLEGSSKGRDQATLAARVAAEKTAGVLVESRRRAAHAKEERKKVELLSRSNETVAVEEESAVEADTSDTPSNTKTSRPGRRHRRAMSAT